MMNGMEERKARRTRTPDKHKHVTPNFQNDMGSVAIEGQVDR